MPSQLHEALLLLFRNRPELAPEVLRACLNVEIPAYTEARIEAADLNELQPTEYRADLVVLLVDGRPVLGIVVEVQLAPDKDKPYTWPMYVAGLRARIRCPVCLLVVTVEESVARWAARPVRIGGPNTFVPLVVGPARVPVVDDEGQARRAPELAVLSAMAHGRGADVEQAVRIACTAAEATLSLDAERSVLYYDLVFASLGEAARKVLQAMEAEKYEFQSEFARRYLARGREEGLLAGQAKGRDEGRVEILLRQIEIRFGRPGADIEARVRSARTDELDRFAVRILTAHSLAEVFSAER